MKEIKIYMEGGVIQHIEDIPDDITIRVYDDNEYCLPENCSDEDYTMIRILMEIYQNQLLEAMLRETDGIFTVFQV